MFICLWLLVFLLPFWGSSEKFLGKVDLPSTSGQSQCSFSSII